VQCANDFLSPGGQEAVQEFCDCLAQSQVPSTVIPSRSLISDIEAVEENIIAALDGGLSEHDPQSSAFVHGGTE
jgi:hypothetical protein